MAERSKAGVCGRSLAGIEGSNPAREHGCLSLVSVVCSQAKVSATGRSLVQRCVVMCDLEASRMRVPASGFCARGKNQFLNNFVITRKFAANWDLSILNHSLCFVNSTPKSKIDLLVIHNNRLVSCEK